MEPCRFYYAPFDVVLPDADTGDWHDSVNVVQPDLLVVCDPSKLTDQGCLGAPDLTVEIISPYTSKKDIREKFDLYERKGVREYWVVFPGERAVHIFRRTEDGRFDEGQVYDLAGPRSSLRDLPRPGRSAGRAVRGVGNQPFTAPAVNPFRKYFWPPRNTAIIGNIADTDAAITRV